MIMDNGGGGSLVSGTRQKGVAAVELTFALFVVLLTTLTAIDGARLINAYSAVAHAAREGVRYAAVRGDEAGDDSYRPSGDAPATQASVQQVVQSYVPQIPVTVTAVWPPDGEGGLLLTAGAQFQLTVATDFIPVVPFLPSITLTSTSSMVLFY